MKPHSPLLPLLALTALLPAFAAPIQIRFIDASSHEPIADLPLTKARITTALFMQAIQAQDLRADDQGLITVEDFGDHDRLIIEYEGRYALIRRQGQQLSLTQVRDNADTTTPTSSATLISPDASSPPAPLRFTIPLRNPNTPPPNPLKGQVVRAW